MKSSRRVVVDTNLLVSRFISRHGAAAEVFRHIYFSCILLASTATVAEFREVICRSKFYPFGTISQREDFVKEVLDHADIVEVVHQVFDCIDPKDNKFLEVALNGEAELIVSGDGRLLRLNPWRGIPILTPREFLNRLS